MIYKSRGYPQAKIIDLKADEFVVICSEEELRSLVKDIDDTHEMTHNNNMKIYEALNRSE